MISHSFQDKVKAILHALWDPCHWIFSSSHIFYLSSKLLQHSTGATMNLSKFFKFIMFSLLSKYLVTQSETCFPLFRTGQMLFILLICVGSSVTELNLANSPDPQQSQPIDNRLCLQRVEHLSQDAKKGEKAVHTQKTQASCWLLGRGF